MEGERRPISVLFADFVGFTEFTSRAGAEQAHLLMRQITTLLNASVQEQGCIVKTFTGDGIVAFFGLPKAFEDAPLRACRAAILIQERLAAAADEIASRYGVRPQLRIGIESGMVVFGEMTEGQLDTAAAHGEIVNLGSRLLTAAEPGAILIGEQTHRYVEGIVETEYAGAFNFKGLNEPQPAHRLLALREEATRFSAAQRRGLSAFVGRADELEALGAMLSDLGALHVVDVAGEPGIGKSRLLHEFRRRLADETAFVLSGGCTSNGEQTPFLPFIEVVRRSFRLSAGEERESVVAKIEEGLMRLGLDGPQNRALVLNLLGLGAPGGVPGLDGALVGIRTQDLLQEFIEAHCRVSRVVLIIEDLHWIDKASEELLSRIIARERQLPLLILHTRRLEYPPPWRERPRVMQLLLAPLSQKETLLIASARFGVDEIPDALADLIAGKAEGNALFVEEIVNYLVEQRIVTRTAAELEYRVPSVVAALPGTLRSLLTASVDRLHAADRSLLQVASVIGRRFDLALLAAIVGAATDHVGLRLAAMERADLVRREGNSRDYVFKHVLVRDALYDSLISVFRGQLHLKVAEEVERRSVERIDEVAEILAYHYSFSDRPDPTFRYFSLAGQKCLDIYSLEEAEQYFRRALGVYEATGGRTGGGGISKTVVGLLEVLYLAGNVLEVKRVAERYIPRLKEAGASADLAFALYFLSLMLANLCQFREGEATARQALDVAEQSGDVKAIAYARSGLYFLAIVLGRTSQEAMDLMARQFLEVCERAADNYIVNWAYWSIAYYYYTRGLVRDARDWLTKLIDAGRTRNDPRALGMAYWTLGWVEIYSGRYDEAERNADEALKTAVATFDRLAASQVKAVAMLLRGRLEEGLERMRTARKWAHDNGWLFAASGCDVSMAWAFTLGGDIRSAVAMLEAGVRSADANGSLAVSAWNRIALAEIYLAMLTSKERPQLKLIFRNLSTIVAAVLFGPRRTRALLEEARNNTLFDERGTMRARIEFDLGRLAHHQKRFDAARANFARARFAAELQGAVATVDEIDRAAAALPSK
jgi:class 3 adenylate cyclase/tetratricopeptide (TPR) repeat protein